MSQPIKIEFLNSFPKALFGPLLQEVWHYSYCNNNQALMNSILNARKEIENLIVVIKEEQIKMKNEINEYNNQLVEEELKRKNIIAKIKSTEKQIYIYKTN